MLCFYSNSMKKLITCIFAPPWIGFKKVEGAIMTITLKLANLDSRYVLTILFFWMSFVVSFEFMSRWAFCLKKNNQCKFRHVKICNLHPNNSCRIEFVLANLFCYLLWIHYVQTRQYNQAMQIFNSFMNIMTGWFRK